MLKNSKSLLALGMAPLSALVIGACAGPESNDHHMDGMDHEGMQHEGMHDDMDHEGMDHDMHEGMDHGSMGHDHAMDLGPADATYDLRFLDGMIPHHEGAVVMAEAALENSQRPEILQLAEEIIAAQAVEIAQMQEWREAWYPEADEPIMYDPATGEDVPMTPEMESAMRMDMDLGGADDEFDRRFIEAMIPHHQGAVDMAEDLLEKTDRPELKALGQEIISSQQAEIDQMNEWLAAWYGS
jgi:uncharacterized protein (DUF305 family)